MCRDDIAWLPHLLFRYLPPMRRRLARAGIRVEAEDIVVCPTTAAAWSPIFGVIAGLVTEHGGLLSHPAILAREYGLPAVLGVAEATSRLRDGSRVEIDGVAGTITLV